MVNFHAGDLEGLIGIRAGTEKSAPVSFVIIAAQGLPEQGRKWHLVRVAAHKAALGTRQAGNP